MSGDVEPPLPTPLPTRTEDGWQRLDRRMLLVDPVRTLGQFAVPGLVALVGIGTADTGFSLMLFPVFVVGAALIGMLPWLTTRFRLTPSQLQLRTGVLRRNVLTAPLDRVRSVDLESSLLHRVLGLTKVTVGTGADQTRIRLDALGRDAALALQHSLLRRSPAVEGSYDDEAAPREQPPHVEELARIDWAWLRFAPFSLSRLVIVAGAFGLLAQFGEDLPFLQPERLEDAAGRAAEIPLALIAIILAVLALLGWLVIAVSGYVVQWWDFRLARTEGSLRLTAGLFTTRSTTVEEARIRGVELTEPVLMRLVGGAELATLATGSGHGGVATVLPPCPVGFATQVGDVVLADAAPLAARLTRHGPVARRRRLVRGVLPAAVLAIGAAVAGVLLDWPWWGTTTLVAGLLVAGSVAGEAAYRNLGHALTDAHLVAGHPDVARRRTALETDGIIGWVVNQSWWQRRLGLATLVATTAAGREHVTLTDVPLEAAIGLADSATPGLLAPFLLDR